MLDTLDSGQNWQWAAFGKHPAAKDYFQLGESNPFLEGLFAWIEDGYQLLTTKETAAPDFCSWRFCAKAVGKESLVCGVVRVSSDSFGRPYPLVITGVGSLRNWQNNWDLLPFACEKTWSQIEYLASNLFPDLKKLEEGMHTIRPPVQGWAELKEKRKVLNSIGSSSDPYASFLDVRELKKLAVANADKGETYVSLDRGHCNDKIMRVSLWHLLFKDSVSGVPNAVFMGGTLEKAYLALFRRPLKSTDFTQLWSVSSAGAGKNMIGTEFSMDISELGRHPISIDKPTGVDIRYDPSFDELQTEVDKLSSPAAAGSVNWEKVCRFASEILMNRSKDLVAAGYLAVSLIYRRQNDGFAMGLNLYLDLLENFWEDLYPPKHRARGRVRAIEWWAVKTEIALKQQKGLSFPSVQLDLIRNNLSRLEILLSERLENAPSLVGIREAINGLSSEIEKVPRPEPRLSTVSDTEEEAVSNPAGKEEDISSEGSSGRNIVSSHEAGQALEDGMNKIREASFYLWKQDLAVAVAYRMTRKAAWYSVEDLPPAVNGRTRIPPPTTVEKNLLFGLRNKGDAEALLKAAEARLTQYIFWLDLNRLSAEALSRLGTRFERAYQTVCQETSFLLLRLPGLEELSFSDGTPFATPETRQWLESITCQRASVGKASQSFPDAPLVEMEEVIKESIDEIQLLLRKGRLIEAMENVQEKLRASSSRREMLHWRLALSTMLVDIGKSKLAIPHIDQILMDMDKHGLEEYEPMLAMSGLRLAWFTLDAQPDQKFKDRASDVLHRIGRVDMPEMVRLAKE
ncbi:MAG: type VI secretion system protein TssA [Geobacteraceae bacterium]